MGLKETEILPRLQRIDEYSFERFIAELWDLRGWDTAVTKASKDKGIDVVATRSIPYSEKELIQAKRYRSGNKVSGPEIQQYASLKQQEEGVDKVVIVCTSDFTDDALSLAEDTNVKCIDGMTLANMVTQLGAEDLVQEFTDPIDNVTPIESDTDTSSPARHNQSEYEEDEAITLVESGENVSAELVGLESIALQYSEGHFLSNNVDFEGAICAIKLFNQNDRAAIIIEDLAAFEIDDTHGNTYKPANLGQLEFDDDWVGHGDEFTNRIETPAGGIVKYAVGANLPSHAKIARIRIGKFDIEIDVDHEARKRLPDLPKGISAAF